MPSFFKTVWGWLAIAVVLAAFSLLGIYVQESERTTLQLTVSKSE